jgi:hypothetical protein
MKIRHVARAAAVSAVVASAGVLAMAGTAGAAGLGTVSPIGTVTAGTPFSSGQTVKVTVAPGTLTSTGGQFEPGVNITLIECSAPNGVVPSPFSLTDCDPGDTQSGDSIIPTGGGFSYSNYQVLALGPGSASGSGSNITCGSTAATECVIGAFDDYNDLSQPYVFTQPFKIAANADDGGENPGDGTPEVPLAIGLPLAAAGLLAGGIALRRRRSARSAA